MSIQDDVAAVCDRGYYEKSNGDPWTKEQLAARQVAKLTEELAELTEAIWAIGQRNGPAPWEESLWIAGKEARMAFDGDSWENAEVTDAELAAGELADIQVVVFTLADALGEDVLELAREKALSDVERGVREANDAND